MYEDRIIAYIDILGFKNAINNKTVPEKRIYDFISLIHKDFADRKVLPDSSYEVTQASDALAISYSISEKASVFQILMSLLYLHIDAIDYGFLIRGAVTYGELVHNKTHLFGPAMNKAVKIEEDISVYPRILVDKKVIDIACENPFDSNTPDSERLCLEKFLKIDFDGFYYIDYLGQGCEIIMEDYGCDALPDYLNKFSKIINEQESTNDKKIIQKYNWLKGKFNSALEELKNSEINSEDQSVKKLMEKIESYCMNS